MRKRVTVGLLTLLAFTALPCMAAKRDGNQLYEWIKSLHRWEDKRSVGGDEINAANLIGYISGIVDYGKASDRFCPPEGVSLSQVVSIIEKSLIDFPETRNTSAVVLIDKAMVQAFPCRK